LEFVLSATAPLSVELADQIERSWHTRVLEIYGSTETGAMATRRTTDGNRWTVLPGGRLEIDSGRTVFRADHDQRKIDLQDSLQSIDEQHFALLGRHTDLIKVAGKRASLTELNARILAIPGVQDAVVFQPRDDDRVAALVVAPSLTERAIAVALRRAIDEVFVPRPLRLVRELPRDASGKVARATLLQMLAEPEQSNE
jgi:acyl-coenzyme A synthetase/AMP-(fatty) acid ligase